LGFRNQQQQNNNLICHVLKLQCPKTSTLMLKNVHCSYNHFQIKANLYSAWWYFCRNLLQKTNDVNNHMPLYLRRTYSEIIMLRNLMGRKRPLGRSSQTEKIIKMHKTKGCRQVPTDSGQDPAVSFCEHVMNLQAPYKARDFLTSTSTISFPH